ncbi:MAG: hypothetical protein VW935_10700, partial [Novosphingobium sp.]
SAPVSLRVPHFWPELCSTDVLTMEYVEGHRAASPEVAALPQSVRNVLGKRYATFGTFSEVDEVFLAEAPGAQDPRAYAPGAPRRVTVSLRAEF